MEKELAEKIVQKYGTRDPQAVCEAMGISVYREKLGAVAGYYNRAYDQKFIHLNRDLMPYRIPHLLAVCLYHALTDDTNLIYRERKERLDYAPMELPADRFAVAFLDTRRRLMELDTMQQGLEQQGAGPDQQADFYAWLDTMSAGKTYRKYKEDDRLNQALYIMDRIEGKI